MGTRVGLATTATCSRTSSTSGVTSPGRMKRTTASAERSRFAVTGTKKIGKAYSELRSTSSSVEAKFDGAWIAGQRNSGHGNGDEWNEQVWLPIPPPKSYVLRVQGFNGSIEGSIELDGSGIVEAATQSEALWPEDEA